MAYFEVPSDPQHGEFRAVIATDGVYDSGKVMIQPPFRAGEKLLGLIRSDGVDFFEHVSTETATVLDFRYSDADESNPDENLERVAEEVDFLLGELGYTGSIEGFKAYWAQFNAKGKK